VLALAIIATIIVAWSAFSGPLDRRGVTSAIAFVAAGVVAGQSGLGVLDFEVESAAAVRITELALVLLLFSDASRLDLHSLRQVRGWPLRLLAIGLPLTLLAGMGAALFVFPGVTVASAFLLSTMLASTDAALGQKVVSDPSVPERVRQALDVESGLNDGLAVPFFLVALDVANAELQKGVTRAVLENAAAQVGWGLLAGVGAGVVSGLCFRLADGRRWMGVEWRQVLPLAAALQAYAAAAVLGGSGFIAAFVGGAAFGWAARDRGTATLFTEEAGDLLAAMTWIGFGALALSRALPHLTWRVMLYALLSLTVVRAVPVALALLGAGARPPTVAFIAWFGPRGLASVVFALLVVERGAPGLQPLLATVTATIALSVLLHGLSSVPLVAAYHRWYAAQVAARPAVPESAPVAMARRRRQPGAAPPRSATSLP
jgi:NhaP-type Na+/H+ or K+/H+ antiporter